MTLDQAIELHDEAGRLEDCGDLPHAEILCAQALAAFEREEGPCSPDAANMSVSLGRIQEKRGAYQAALGNARRAVRIIEPLLPLFEDSIGRLIFFNALSLEGACLRGLGRYPEALPTLERAIEVAESLPDHVTETASAWNNLGMVCKYAGWFERGEAAYAKAMASAERAGGRGVLLVAAILHNIGGIRHASGDFAAAEEPARRAWELRRAILGDTDLSALADAVAYAGVLDGLDRHEESRPIYERALAVYEERLGPVHFEVAATLHNLALVQEPEQGIVSARRALAIKRELLGPDHPDTALTALCLSSLLRARGQAAEARALGEHALAVFETTLDASHPHVLHARACLAE